MATPYMDSNLRSVTPATSNSRYVGRYPAGPRTQELESPQQAPYNPASSGSFGYNRRDDTAGGAAEPRTPSSTGLIRLSLKKPMGIVFEPMYDPNQPSVQRGVRICDLPRTGAAAMSRKLQVGDELLQINDTTVSRMTFDEIMDFIIEADPESVNLLFRRPRKETLQARQGVPQKLNAAANKDNPSTVKWDDEIEKTKERKSSQSKDKSKSGRKKRPKKDATISEGEDETQQSSMAGDSFDKRSGTSRRKKNKSRRGPYESESFLDLLIDTICSNSNGICRDVYRKDDEYSDEEDSMASLDEETYATYDESLEPRAKSRKGKAAAKYDEESKERDSSRRKHRKEEKPKSSKKYEDDGTLETVDTTDRAKEERQPLPPTQTPLGLAPDPMPVVQPPPVLPVIVSEPEEEANPAPIKEFEFDKQIDHGADVSVMESLGGPSLLVEPRRAVAPAPAPVPPPQVVPEHIIENYGLDYPPSYGMTRQETIQNDPLKFYMHVVKRLLEENEPEKVRLLDKLLAKYNGREDHLVQKLSVRYVRQTEEEEGGNEGEENEAAFTDAVQKSKSSSNIAAAVNIAKDRMQTSPVREPPVQQDWPEKEHKEEDIEEDVDEEQSGSGSEYSGDSVDGTSPAVIAQVSELLNYVYGKTSVPGQIDRVSTIMRAYEGREAVLLELLETKALIKANKEKENAGDLPAFLRNSHLSQAQQNTEDLGGSGLPPVTPLATQGGTVINDDISSMSGVSNPAPEPISQRFSLNDNMEAAPMQPHSNDVPNLNSSESMGLPITPTVDSAVPVSNEKDKKKKKGLFGGLFSRGKGKDTAGANSRTKRR